MKFGTNISDKDGSVNFGYLEFDSGKKIMLDAEECKEMEDRLKLARAEGKLAQQDPKTQEKDYYLLVIAGDIEAELQGPFDTDEDRDQAALQHRNEDPEMEDGLHPLDVSKGTHITVADYSGGFFIVEDEDVQV